MTLAHFVQTRHARRATPPPPTARCRRLPGRWTRRCRAACPCRRRLAPRLEPGVVGRLQRTVQRRGVVAAVVLQRHRRLVRERIVRNEVAPAQLDPIDAGVMRHRVHQPLQQERRLRPAGAAIRIHRHRVGEDRLHLAVNHRSLVHPRQQRRVQIGRHTGREGRQIGAHVGQRAHAQRQEMSVLVDRHLRGRDMVAAMRIRHETFVTFGGPLHRLAHLAGRPGDDRLLGVVIDLRPEPAAHVGRHHTQLVLRDVQHEGAHQQPDYMRVLAGGVEREVTRRLVSKSPTAARGSIALGISRLFSSSSFTTFAAPANAASTPPCRQCASRNKRSRPHRHAPARHPA